MPDPSLPPSVNALTVWNIFWEHPLPSYLNKITKPLLFIYLISLINAHGMMLILKGTTQVFDKTRFKFHEFLKGYFTYVTNWATLKPLHTQNK